MPEIGKKDLQGLVKKKTRPNNLAQHSYRGANATLFPGGTAAEIVNIVKAARKAKEVEAARREMMKRLLEVFFEVFLKGLPKSISKFQSILNVSKRYEEVPKRISKFGLVQVGERAAAKSWKSKKQVLLVLNVLGQRGPLIV